MSTQAQAQADVVRPTWITDDVLSGLVARVPSSTGAAWKLTEVYTGDLLVELPQSSPEDVTAAAATARDAQKAWGATPVRERMRVFERAFELILRDQTKIADLIQVESGKARRMAYEEACDPVMVISHYLRRAPKLLKDRKRPGPVPFISGSTEVHPPRGLIGIIAPWNFPFATGISDAVPALMAGNAVIVKPDNKTALSPLYGIALLEEAGLPKGLFQVVTGEGPDIGPTLIDSVDYVMFTGSSPTGRVIGEQAGRNLIDCCLELGGKNPSIVLDDVDLDEVMDGILFACFGNTGQICMHTERIYVPDSRYEEFRDRLVAATEALSIGPSYDFGTDLGGLVSPDHLERVRTHVEDAVAKGARVLTGGKARPDLGPTFFEPTILEGATKEMEHGVVETFGPVVSLHRYSTLDEAVELANDTDYGLNAAVWTSDLARGHQVARRIESGSVNINDGLATSFSAKATPSGGFKQSGVGARNGDQGLLKYTETQNIAVLKKQVMGPRPGQSWEAYTAQMQASLRWMRKLRIR